MFVQLALSLILASFLMVIDYRYQYLDVARSTVSTMLTPVYYLANIPSELASWADDNIISRSDLLEQNQQLKDELLILTAQNQRLVGLESENARLRHLLGSSRQLRGKRLIAEVLNVDASPFSKQVIINKGAKSDVYVGQPVVDAVGIMGQVIAVSSQTSRVIILNDPTHAIPVKDHRNGLRAIAQGNGLNLYLRHLPNTTDIKRGDLLLSSGLGEKYPDGYPVAKVVSVVKKQDQPYAEIIAEPTANINTADHVLLLWPQKTGSRAIVPESSSSKQKPIEPGLIDTNGTTAAQEEADNE